MFKDREKRTFLIYGGISIILLIAVICLFVEFVQMRKNNEQVQKPVKTSSDSDKGKLFEHMEIPEEVVTVNTQIIEDGLRDMGILITEEYYFTQVEEYSTSKRVLIFDSKASFTYSYDGVVNAGIDCNKVSVDKDEDNKRITIHIPSAEIIGVSIDKNSFKVYEEKDGLWNKADIKNYNDSLIEFENAAKSKAIEKGIVKKADEGALKMISSFVGSLIDSDEYKIEYITD